MDANDFFRQFVNHIKHAMKWYSRWSTANQILIEEQRTKVEQSIQKNWSILISS